MTQLDIRRQPEGEIGYPSAPPDLPQKGVVQVLWTGRWYVLFSTLLLIGAGFFYASQQTPIYSSSSSLIIEPDGPRVIVNEGLTAGERSANWLATQCDLIRSSKILDKVLTDPIRINPRRMKTFDGADSPIAVLKGSLTADVGVKDDVVTVTFESPYPVEAAQIVNAVVDEYGEYHRLRRRTTAAETVQSLLKSKDEQDKEYQVRFQDLQKYKREHPNLQVSGKDGEFIVAQLSKVSQELSTAQFETLDLASRLEGARAMSKDPSRMELFLRQQAGGGPVGGLNAQVQGLEIDMAARRQSILTNHTEMLKLQAELEAMKLKVDEQTREWFSTYLAVLEQSVITAQKRQAALQKAYEQQTQLAATYNTEQTEFAIKDEEARRSAKMSDLLDSRIREIKIGEEGNTGGVNLNVLEVGKPAAYPIKPKKPIILFGAGVIGLVLGCGLAYLREWMDHRLGSLDEIRALLNLNVIGVLPHMPGRESAGVRGQKVQLDPMSEIAEGYRTIRTAVYFGAPEGRTKTILITSPAPGDGKSTSASNLAIAMAQAGQRVLLLDADFRKPVQHKTFGIDDGIGLTSVVAGQAPLSKAVKPTGTRGLYLLPCGPIPRNPSEILNSQTFAQLMAKLEEKFDHVVIDSPPVVPVTDARILGASADVTILVVRAQKSTRKVTVQARDSLMAVGSRILGLIVNDVPRGRSGYDFYAYGYYRRPYGNVRQAKALEGKTNGARIPASVSVEDEGEEV